MKNKLVLEMYDSLTKKGVLSVVASGRYITTSIWYPKKLAQDIVSKLQLNDSDVILDLGCNVGYYHRYLAKYVRAIYGVDGGATIIETAKQKNTQSNVSYFCFDIVQPWPQIKGFPEKFDKILVYSVIHFFEDIDLLKRLLTQCNTRMSKGAKLMLGEVRIAEKYDSFRRSQQEKSRKTLRDWKFEISRKIQAWYLGSEMKSGFIPKSFSEQELRQVASEAGFDIKIEDQQSFHPFYNTCSDLILTKT